MKRPIKILLLDDEADEFIEDFEISARSHQVIVKAHFTNSKEGIDYIRKNSEKIDAIILDGFFKLKKNSSDKKDIKALKNTVEELKRILYLERLRIPFCVLTGYLEDISKDSLLSDIQVFEKGRDVTKLFNHLKEIVNKNESYQIKSSFHEIFEVFDNGLLPNDKETDLIKILQKLKSKAKYNSDDAFNPIRKIYEVLVTELYNQTLEANINQNVVPDALFGPGDELNITGSYYYLSGFDVKRGDEIFIRRRDEQIWPDHISNLANLVVQITHQNSHDYPEDVHHYTYKSVVYALLELILWYKEFITNYKKKHTNG